MRMILAATLAIVPLLAKSNEPVERLEEAAAVFSEIMATPDKGIPQDMLANAEDAQNSVESKRPSKS